MDKNAWNEKARETQRRERKKHRQRVAKSDNPTESSVEDQRLHGPEDRAAEAPPAPAAINSPGSASLKDQEAEAVMRTAGKGGLYDSYRLLEEVTQAEVNKARTTLDVHDVIHQKWLEKAVPKSVGTPQRQEALHQEKAEHETIAAVGKAAVSQGRPRPLWKI